MTRKTGICENCNRSKVLYGFELSNFGANPMQKTVNWWCMDCYHANSEKLRKGLFNYLNNWNV